MLLLRLLFPAAATAAVVVVFVAAPVDAMLPAVVDSPMSKSASNS